LYLFNAAIIVYIVFIPCTEV